MPILPIVSVNHTLPFGPAVIPNGALPAVGVENSAITPAVVTFPILLGIGVVIVLEIVRYPLDWWLFGRSASYHALSAKSFGASLLVVVTSIMVFDYAGYLLWISLLLGLFSELEGVAISLVLPEWTHDVRNLRRAFAIRTEKLRALA